LLLSNRSKAINEAAVNVHSQNADRYRASQLTLVVLLATISSSLLSCGDESSEINRQISRSTRNVQCPRSDLALFPYSLKYNRNGHLSLVHALDDDVLMAIFGKHYNLVKTVPNGTPVNAAEGQQTRLLEVSFGFAEQEIQTPGDVPAVVEADLGPNGDVLVNEVDDFQLSFFDFTIQTNGNFNHVINAFRQYYIFPDFSRVLIKYWLYDLLLSSSSKRLIRKTPTIVQDLDQVFRLGSPEQFGRVFFVSYNTTYSHYAILMFFFFFSLINNIFSRLTAPPLLEPPQ
jgi:hypothetical protein